MEADFWLDIPIYDQSIAVFWTGESFGAWCDEKGFEKDDNLWYSAASFHCRDGEKGKHFALVVPVDLAWWDIGHECLHAAWAVLEYVGVMVHEENHEALAYLQGFLCESLHEKINADFDEKVLRDRMGGEVLDGEVRRDGEAAHVASLASCDDVRVDG